MFACFLLVRLARLIRPVIASIPAERESVQRYYYDSAYYYNLALEPRLRLYRVHPTSIKGNGPPAAFRNRIYKYFPPGTCGSYLEKPRITVVGPGRLFPNRRKYGRNLV